MLIICLLLNFVFEKVDFNAWNVFWSGSTKNNIVLSCLLVFFFFFVLFFISQQTLKNCLMSAVVSGFAS